jgi:hypothetical protein
LPFTSEFGSTQRNSSKNRLADVQNARLSVRAGDRLAANYSFGVIYRRFSMIDTRLSDEERLEEIGHLLALGALRLLREKRANSSKKRFAGAAPAGLIVRDRERFAAQKCLPDGPARISLN